MARYAAAQQMILPQNAPGYGGSADIIPCLVVLHTNGGNNTLEGSYKYWERRPDGSSNSGGKEAHFQLETAPPNGKGRLGQYMDTARRADNTGPANSFTRNGRSYGAISIETSDLGSPYTKSWTDLGQRRQLEDWLVWCCQTHGIEPVLAYPVAAGGWNGIGYHRQYPEWNPNGHVCPGDGKQAEVPDLIAAVARRVRGQETDMPLDNTDKAFISGETNAVAGEVWAAAPGPTAGQAAGLYLLGVNQAVADLAVAVAELRAVNDQILAAIQGAEFPVSGTVHIGSS